MKTKREDFLKLLHSRRIQLDVTYAIAARALSQEHYLTGMIGRVRGGAPIISPKLQHAANLVCEAAPDRMVAVATDAIEALALFCVALHDAAPEPEQATLRAFANVLEALQGAVRRGDLAALKDPQRWAKGLTEARVKSTSRRRSIATGKHPQTFGLEALPTAKSFAKHLLATLTVSVENWQGPGVGFVPVTRWVMADLLAVYLQSFFPQQPHDVLMRAVYAQMPLFRAKGPATDRSNGFKDEPFGEDLRRTIIAAFKAAGFPPRRANGLFDSETKLRRRRAQSDNRKMSERAGQAKGRPQDERGTHDGPPADKPRPSPDRRSLR